MFRLSRLSWIQAMVVAVLAGATAGRASAARPNVLLITTDDQAYRMTGFEGNERIKTPHLDQLAAEGAYFSRCYVPTPQCAPARATILTGLYPHSHGITTNGNDKNPMALPASADTISYRFKRAGYACGFVGKWHLSYANASKPGFGFVDYTATHNGDWKWHDSKVFVQGEETKADKYLTDWEADRTIECIERYSDRPLFLWWCLRSPHAPLKYPPGSEGTYPPDSIELPETRLLNPDKVFPAKVRKSPPVTAYKGMDETALRGARSKYFAMISNVDANVGRVLTKLDELKLADNTIVIFCSDNGWALGDHALFSKGPFFYDELVRMPLVVRCPGRTKPGTRIDRVVSLVDLAPTILDLAGLPAPPTLQGSSLVKLLDNPRSRDHADECFLEYDEQKGAKYPVRGLVTRHYKFIDYLGEREDMLFDLKRDPNEMINVARTPEYQSILNVMRNRLEAWREETNDPVKLK